MTTVNAVGNSLVGQSGTGAFAGNVSPSFTTPVLGTPASGNLANCTGYPSDPIWAANAGTSISAAVNNGYITTAATLATVTLPTTFAVGTVIGVAGQGAGGWVLAVGAATNIKAFGNTYTTSLASTNVSDTVLLVATVANTTWGILSMISTGLTAS